MRSNYYSKLTQHFINKPVIFGWRERNFHNGWTKVRPIDAEFKDKSNGGTYNIWKSFSEKKSPKNLEIEGETFFLHHPVQNWPDLKIHTQLSFVFNLQICDNFLLKFLLINCCIFGDMDSSRPWSRILCKTLLLFIFKSAISVSKSPIWYRNSLNFLRDLRD